MAEEVEVIKAIIIIYKMYVVYSFEREKNRDRYGRERTKPIIKKASRTLQNKDMGGRTHKDEKTKHGGKLFHNSDIPRSEKGASWASPFLQCCSKLFYIEESWILQ